VLNVVPFSEKFNFFSFRQSAFQAIARFPHSTPERLTASRLTGCAVT